MKLKTLAGLEASLAFNLSRVWNLRIDADVANGLTWYERAHRLMVDWSGLYGYSIRTCANVTAAISPQCDWPRNLIIADEVLSGRASTEVTAGALPLNVRKACAIRDARAASIFDYFPHGPKVNSFADNLAGDLASVTVDRHAIEAARFSIVLPEADFKATWPHYAVYARAYATAAANVGLESANFQAIIWHVWKRCHPPEMKRAHIKRWRPRHANV